MHPNFPFWPTSFLPFSGDSIVSRTAEKNSVINTAKWTYQWWGDSFRWTWVMNQLLFHYSEDTVAREKRLTLSSPLKQLSVFDPWLQWTASPTIFFCYCKEQKEDRNLNKTGLDGFPLRSVFLIALLWFSCVVNAYWEKRDPDFRQLIKNTLQKKSGWHI